MDHRQYLGNTFREIATNRYSPQARALIKEERLQWQDREFPVRWRSSENSRHGTLH